VKLFKKEKNRWIKEKSGLIELTFNPVFDSSLKYSERISTMFFNSDGSSRSFEMKISSNNTNQKPAQMEMSGQKIMLTGSPPCVFKWPGTESQKATLSVYLSDSFSTGISYNGPWCFFKLMQVSKINRLDANTFIAKWKVNVQNMYSVYISSRFQVPGGDTPFSEPVFEKVRVPSDLLINN
jgi:type VI protein secretion system component VasK